MDIGKLKFDICHIFKMALLTFILENIRLIKSNRNYI